MKKFWLTAFAILLPILAQAQPRTPPGFIPQVTFANLPTGIAAGTVRFVTNTNGTACNGSGSIVLQCRWTGSAWTPIIGGAVSGSADVTIATNTGVPTGSQARLDLGIIGDDRVLKHYNNDDASNAVAYYGFFRSRGTFAAPTTVTTGMNIGAIAAYPYDGTDYTPHSGIMMFTSGEAGDMTPSDRGTDWHLALVPIGGTSLRARIYFPAAGGFDLRDQGTPVAPNAPAAYANIEQGAITAARPVFRTTATWNNAGVTFTGRLTNITSTNSAAASLIEDWQVGAVSKASIRKDGLLKAVLYGTDTNCSDGTATPADCSAAAAGSVIISAAATAVTVNTTAVTANSQIFIQEDSSLGAKLGVTCNTTISRTYAVTARTAGTSFTITASAAPTTNPACLSYSIVN